MKKIALTLLLILGAPYAATAANEPWYATVYQNIDAGGLSQKLNVVNGGFQGIPVDEFEKYHLQDEISEVRYKLPKGAALVLFTGRFFKNTDGDIANWWNKHAGALIPIIKNGTGIAVGKFGEGPLALKGTGNDEVVRLDQVAGGKYNDKIRSSKIVDLR